MNIFGLNISRSSAVAGATPPARGSGAWYPVIREPYTGAWQANQEMAVPDVVSYGPVFACVNLIACDISKLRLRLVEMDDEGIWTETSNAAWNPVLRKPNRYQTIIKFIEQWIVSKELHGNTYVLKDRDQRGVVKALYVLDPQRVMPLVAPDGSVFYQLYTDELTGIDAATVAVPAREIIHDRGICLWHPLIGVSPIYACGMAALMGLQMQKNSANFFGNGSNPGGVLTAPGVIADDTAKRLKDYWDTQFTGANQGKVAVLGDGLKYEAMHVNAVDSELISQLQWTASNVATCFRVPLYMIDSTKAPPYANSEPLTQQYYSQCLQNLIVNFETCLDEGLEFPNPRIGTELDVDDLIWMDTATKTKAAGDAVGSGVVSPDEARKKYFGLGKVAGGHTPYMQQQYFSLEALSKRDESDPFAKPAAPAPAPPAAQAASTAGSDDTDSADQTAEFSRLLLHEMAVLCAG